jgi:hypothetical protein
MAYQVQKESNTTQMGSPAGSGGTTSAISKPATPTSLATEYGGITSSTSGQTVTLQTTLDKIPITLAGKGDIVYCTAIMRIDPCLSQKTLDLLGRFGVGVTLNTAASSSNNVSGSATGTPQGNAQKVSLNSIGSKVPSLATAFMKYTIIKPKVQQLPKKPGINVLPQSQTMRVLAVNLATRPQYKEWQYCVVKKMAAASQSERVDVFNKYYAQVVPVLFDGATVDCVDNPSPTNLSSSQALTADQKELVSEVVASVAAADLIKEQFATAVHDAAAAPLLSVEYDYNTPQNQPTNSTVKLAGSKGWGKFTSASSSSNVPDAPAPLWMLTYNGGVSLYDSSPASTISGASTLRDVQAGAQIDYNVPTSKLAGIWGKIGDSTASATYYFQYQSSPSILNVTPGSPLNGITIVGLPSNATQIFTQKGSIHVFQLKYGFGTGTNVRFPIAVTYSNRTELIAHPAWGLQFGVTYDFSSLLGGSNSKSK